MDFKTAGDAKDPSLMITGTELGAFYDELASDFPIVTIEDPFDEDDWATWSKFTANVGSKYQVVGDDLTVTNPVKIQKAVEEKSCNCLLLKVFIDSHPKLHPHPYLCACASSTWRHVTPILFVCSKYEHQRDRTPLP